MASWIQVADAIQQLLVSSFATIQTLPPTKVYVGWPEPNTVQKDLRDRNIDNAHVSIWHTGKTVPTSRYGYDEKIVKFDATESVTIVSNVVTIGGIPTQGDNVFLHINGAHTFAVHVELDDTPTSIASRLAAAINASALGIAAAPSGAAITLSANPTVFASVVGAAFGKGSSTTEVTREQATFAATIWAPNEVVRDLVGSAAKQYLSGMQFLDFADLSKGRILYAGELPSDASMSAGYVTGRVLYSVEFATYKTEYFARVGTIFGTLSKSVPDGSLSQIADFEVF